MGTGLFLALVKHFVTMSVIAVVIAGHHTHPSCLRLASLLSQGVLDVRGQVSPASFLLELQYGHHTAESCLSQLSVSYFPSMDGIW